MGKDLKKLLADRVKKTEKVLIQRVKPLIPKVPTLKEFESKRKV